MNDGNPAPKKNDRSVKAVFQEITIGQIPNMQCLVRLLFRPGCLLSKKMAEEKTWEKDMDDLLGPIE